MDGTVAVVSAHGSLESLLPIRSRLDALNLASRRPSPFATVDYLDLFLRNDEHALPGQRPLFLVVTEAGREIGWIALRTVRERVLGVSSTRVTFLTTHDVDRPGLVCAPEDEERCAAAVWRHLAEVVRPDVVELMAQDVGSPLLPLAARFFPGWRLRTFDSIPNSTLHLTEPSLVGWFRSLQKKHRLNVGRLGRRLLSAGEVEFVTARDPAAVELLLDVYLDVERRSWKSRAAAGIGRHPARVALFRSQCLPGRSAPPIIHLVTLDGVPVAAMFGVEFGGGLFAREITFDEGFEHLAPGHLLMLLAIAGAMARGLGLVNLLGFFGYYKTRWGASISPTRGVQLIKPWSSPWALAWGRGIRRRLAEGVGSQGDAAHNPSRRESEEGEPPGSPQPAPLERRAERALLQEVYARIDAVGARVEKIGGEDLAASLPYRTGSEN